MVDDEPSRDTPGGTPGAVTGRTGETARQAVATLTVTHVLKKGCSEQYRRWTDAVVAAVTAAPGYRGTLRLDQSGGLCHVVQRFDDREALAAWQGSADYRRLAAAAEAFSTSREQTAVGVAPTIRLPSEEDSAKWKRFLMTWGAVLPLISLFNVGLRALPFTLPALVQSVLTSSVMVASMTWVILPAVSRRLKPWVMRDGDGDARAPGDGG